MRLPTFLLTFTLIMTACATPIKDLPSTETTTTPTLESSLLAVEWQGDVKGNLLFPLDPTSGAALPGYDPISLGQSYSHAFSPDRRTLAAVVFPHQNNYNGKLLLIDLPAWKTLSFVLKTSGWVTAMAFSPDGKHLAIAQGESTYQLTIFDLEQGVITAQTEDDSYITRLKFTADSESLMLYGMTIENRFTENEMSVGAPQVELRNVGDLSTGWIAELEGVRDGVYPTDETVAIDYNQPGTAMYLAPALAFAPNRDTLYVVHADSDHLTTVDFSTRTIATVEIEDQLSWFERLLSLTAGVAHAKVADGTSKQAVISPDGQFMYVVGMRNESLQDKNGNWQMNQTPLGLGIIQTGDGSRLGHFETDATELSLAPDGLILYLRSWTNSGPFTETFDISNLQITAHHEEMYASPALLMNGEPLLISTYSSSESENHISVLQPDGMKVLTEWTNPRYIAWLTQ